MTKLKAYKKNVDHVQDLIDNTDISHISTDMSVICHSIKALMIETVLFQGEDSEELNDLWERLEELKEETNWSLRPIVRYSTGEELEIYKEDPYFDHHGKEKDFLKMYGENKVDRVVLIREEVIMYLEAESFEDLILND